MSHSVIYKEYEKLLIGTHLMMKVHFIKFGNMHVVSNKNYNDLRTESQTLSIIKKEHED